MNIFLCQPERYRAALETFDPLRGEWLFSILDPWPNPRHDAAPKWLRLAFFLLILCGPIVLFLAIPSPFFGGHLTGKGGLLSDIGAFAIFCTLVLSLSLITITRRVIGDLQSELVGLGIVGSKFRALDLEAPPSGLVLRFFERISRISGRRGVLWYLFFVTAQIPAFYMFLTDGKQTWMSSPTEPGTFFYFFHLGSEQPNLAGLVAIFIYHAFPAYVTLLNARLMIVFACLCSALAKEKSLTIIPYHHDGVGGLRPVGQVALLFSLYVIVLSFDLVGMIANEIVTDKVMISHAPLAQTNLTVLIFWLVAFLVLAPLIFLLPMLPLRVRMAKAKRQYLLDALALQKTLQLKHHDEVRATTPRLDSLEILHELDALAERADAMTTWPFDRRTFLSYAGLLLSPLATLGTSVWPSILIWLRHYLGFG